MEDKSSERVVLYRDSKISILVSKMDTDGHDAIIDNLRIPLPRGILEEWARKEESAFASSYSSVRQVPYEAENPNVPITDFHHALIEAQKREESNYQEWLAQER